MLDSVGRQEARERTRGFQASRTEWAVSSWEQVWPLLKGTVPRQAGEGSPSPKGVLSPSLLPAPSLPASLQPG